jgi:hypothetical protein
MKEPSVLDYIKALLTPWKGKPPKIPFEDEAQEIREAFMVIPESPDPMPVDIHPAMEFDSHPVGEPGKFPWLGLIGVLLALIGQFMLEPPGQQVQPAVILYIIAGVFLFLAVLRNEWVLPDIEEKVNKPFSLVVYRNPLVISIPLLLFATLFFRNNQFTVVNLVFWLTGIIAVVIGLRIPLRGQSGFVDRLREFTRRPVWNMRISGWTVLVILVMALVVFFRFYRLDQVPGEMFSDHAEKLMDVSEVLDGDFSIFFPRNTGREAIQMYLTALVGIIFGTQISFLSLKIGTALVGILALPYIYLLGKEIGGRWVALFALILAGIAYWPNVISRVGLRFPLYPLFVAPTLYYLIRGLIRRQRNDFIWAGIALGLGLHGYSPTRLLSLVVVVAVGLYLLHRQSKGNRKETVVGFAVLVFVSLIVFLPLLVYAIENPQMFGYRAFSRLGQTETIYAGPVGLIFLDNFWKSLVMFFYNNGNIWVHSIPGRPALDVVSAALFFCGLVLVSVRYIRNRNWIDLFLIVSIPLLMLPSILSLAFPEENPSLNRSGGAIVPVFILAAIGLDGLVRSLHRRYPSTNGFIAPAIIAIILLSMSVSSNYDLIFRQFDNQFIRGAWNTSQIGKVIRAFSESQGNPDTAYVIPYPHWVDTRLVGINAGYPQKDYALWLDTIEATLEEPRAKLFIIKPEHVEAVDKVRSLYPSGSLYFYDVELEGKDFLLYFVPPNEQEDFETMAP